jgi:hypothetical protein
MRAAARGTDAVSKLSGLFTVAIVLAILIGLTDLLFSTTATVIVGGVAVAVFSALIFRSRA